MINRMKMRISILGVFIIACLINLNVSAEGWWNSKQESSPTDDIRVTASEFPDKVQDAVRTNWKDGYIEVMAGATSDQRDTVNMAHAYTIALKTARHLAYEKLAETVGGLNLYSDATYDRELMRDSNLKTVVQSIIRGARVVDEKKSQFTDGSVWVEVTLGMKLFGEDGLIKPSTEWQDRREPDLKPAPEPKPANTIPESNVIPADEKYTGLIIDASGLGASPAMLPKIIDESGNIIYGAQEVDRNYVVKMGLMGYQSAMNKAKEMDRIGTNPLIVRATGVKGKNNTDFVVTGADAAQIKSAAVITNFLNECRVVAIIK